VRDIPPGVRLGEIKPETSVCRQITEVLLRSSACGEDLRRTISDERPEKAGGIAGAKYDQSLCTAGWSFVKGGGCR
jgi:hypothetical protein